MSRIVNLGLVQMSCGEDIASNFDKALAGVRKAADDGAQVVCLQELFKSRYFCQVVDKHFLSLAEPVNENSPTVQKLAELAAELEIVIVASLFEKRAKSLFHNTAVVIDADGRYLGKYRKMHIPDDPLYYEKFYFAPGDLGYKTFSTRYAEIGVLICWDQWFPEAARLTAMQGAEIIFIPTAIGNTPQDISISGPEYPKSWQIVQRGHAVANACFLAAVNRVGFEENSEGKGGIDFWGQSFISDPNGVVLAQAAPDQEEVLVHPVDLDLIDAIRDGYSFPFRDRRVDSYGGLSKLYIDD
ncbi:MAG TPA: carbon-nitrogen hydrolase [candidate division Zixibacteria bacterium]|nr:carbon-nitrogen hydrolase [candidate division Zixibacteria bacterium]